MQKGDFLLARLAVPPSVAETLRDNDAVLLSKEDPNVSPSAAPLAVPDTQADSALICDPMPIQALVSEPSQDPGGVMWEAYDSTKGLFSLQAEDAEGRLHAVGRVDSKEGTNIIIVQFYLTADSQAGNPAGSQRCCHTKCQMSDPAVMPEQNPACQPAEQLAVQERKPWQVLRCNAQPCEPGNRRQTQCSHAGSPGSSHGQHAGASIGRAGSP